MQVSHIDPKPAHHRRLIANQEVPSKEELRSVLFSDVRPQDPNEGIKEEEGTKMGREREIVIIEDGVQ